MGIRPGMGAALLTVICFVAFPAGSSAQTTAQISAELNAINAKVVSTPCATGKGMLISNKAMNIFLSEKVTSYLSDVGDLSLYKNYVTLNAAEGSIAINHNFHQPVDSDDWVRSFVVIGARANMANTYASRFSGKFVDNQLGFALQKTWMGKPVTKYDLCGSQKQAMDAQRALIVQQLESGMNQDAVDFERDLMRVTAADLPGQTVHAARNGLRQRFYAGLRAAYLQKFSEAQSAMLISTNNYRQVADHWTTAGVYLPIITQKFKVSSTPASTDFLPRYNYPLALFINHTRFWDSPKTGRIFFTLGAKCSVNNSVQSSRLPQATPAGQYTGNYQNFITPSFSGKLAYLPPDSHVGLSFRIEKNFGTYSALNGIVGIPIVLIDKKGVPAVNFECQLHLADLNNSLKNTALPGNKASIGLTVGIPFSKIVY